ncbi:hypothetical protein BGZ95_010247 [Linnemannia exigua]|uniref:Galactose oxidase n=1 Tax=Linnemannia exigua TaxID=604196 RepID=A0AAD4DBN2_9FUNG|nr:hypothetical protein BGZ95_010247 [Linnemannia exigua]
MVPVKPEHGAGLGGGSKGYLLAIGGNPANPAAFWVAYDIDAGSWKNIPTAIPGAYVGLEGHTAVADPDTGLVYVVGGFYSNTTQNLLTVFDPKTATVVSSQPATDANNRTDVASVWSTKRKSVLTFGGSRAITAVYGFDLGSLQEYDPSSKIWKTMTTSGNVPTRRLDACVAASEDGSKIVLFGGSLDSNTYFDTIYVLDVVTGVWTQGASAPAYRTRMACGFKAGQFVIFGGSRGANRETTMHDNVPLIYNPDLNTWTIGYDPAGPTSEEGTAGGGGDGGKSNTAVIAGAAGGAVAVILAGVVAFFCLRKRRQRKDKEAMDSDARFVASVVDEDERQGLGYRFDPIAHHKKYMHANAVDNERDQYRPAPTYSEAGRGAGHMSAMDHYAAAAALQTPQSPSSSTSGAGGAGGVPPRIHSTYSDVYTHSTSENDYGMHMPTNHGGLLQPPLPSGSTSPIDPELYHQQQQQFQQPQHHDLRQQLLQQQQLYHSLGVASVSTPPTQPDTPMTPFTYSTTGATGYPSGGYEYNSVEAIAAAAAAGHVTGRAAPASALNEPYGAGGHPYQQQQQQGYPTATQPPQQHYQQQHLQQQKRSSANNPQAWTDSVYDTQSQIQSHAGSTPSQPAVTPMTTQFWMSSDYHPSDSGAQNQQQQPQLYNDNNINNNDHRMSTGTISTAVSGGSGRAPQGIIPQTPGMPPRSGGRNASMSSRPGGGVGDLGYVPPPS